MSVLIALAALNVAGLGFYIYSGGYPVAADVPHSGPVFWLLGTVRNRSVATRARNVGPRPTSDATWLVRE
ncbi:MAG: hypothetical protein ACREV7_15130 [Steroidobacteraceae bacterium]